MERWRVIEGFKCKYFVSDSGKVYSKGVNRLLNSSWNKTDKCVTVKLNCPQLGKRKIRYPLHRQVAIAFVEKKYPHQNIVKHIDGDKRNNNASNLEWTL